MIQTPRDETIQFFIDLQTYEGGLGENLYRLCQLDDTDKHTIISLAWRAGTVPPLELVDPEGKIVQTMPAMRFAGGQGGAGMGFPTKPGHSVQFKAGVVPILDLTFRDHFAFSSVFPTLHDLADRVSETLRKFENFVQTRG